MEDRFSPMLYTNLLSSHRVGPALFGQGPCHIKCEFNTDTGPMSCLDACPQFSGTTFAADWSEWKLVSTTTVKFDTCISSCPCRHGWIWFAQPRLKERLAAAKETAKKPCHCRNLNHPSWGSQWSSSLSLYLYLSLSLFVSLSLSLFFSLSIAIPNAHVFEPKVQYMFEQIHKIVELEIETQYVISGLDPNEVRRADCNRTAPEVSRLNSWSGVPTYVFKKGHPSALCVYVDFELGPTYQTSIPLLRSNRCCPGSCLPTSRRPVQLRSLYLRVLQKRRLAPRVRPRQSQRPMRTTRMNPHPSCI